MFFLHEDGVFDVQAVNMVVRDHTVHRLSRREAFEATRRLVDEGLDADDIRRLLGNPSKRIMTRMLTKLQTTG